MCSSVHVSTYIVNSVMEPARVIFSKLKAFPPAIEGKIETEEFLKAANEIVEVIRKCRLRILYKTTMTMKCDPFMLGLKCTYNNN